MLTKEKDYKIDEGKVRMDLIMPEWIMGIGKVLTYGANNPEYGPWSWMLVRDPVNRYYAAAMRHIIAWRMGESYDGKSKLHHLLHAATNLFFLFYFDTRRPTDDCDQLPQTEDPHFRRLYDVRPGSDASPGSSNY